MPSSTSGNSSGKSGKRRVTIMDVAREANVSIAAVSRILNNSYDGFSAREETKQRVYAAVKKLGYRASRAAVRLATGKHQAVALCYPAYGALSGPIDTSSVATTLSQLDQMLQIHGASRAANEANFDLVLMLRSPDRPLEHVLSSASESVDGMIYMSPEDDDAVLKQLQDSDLPIVVVGATRAPLDKICTVRVDEFTAGRMAMGHLIVAGSRRVLVAVPESHSHEAATVSRVEGIAHSVKSFSDPKMTFEVLTLPDEMDLARTAFLSHMGGWGVPDGVLTLGGVLPFAIMKALEMQRVRVPDDCKVVGFDENPMYALHTPAITGIRYPVEEMSRRAVQLLIERVRTGNESTSVTLTPKMIARKSSEALDISLSR